MLCHQISMKILLRQRGVQWPVQPPILIPACHPFGSPVICWQVVPISSEVWFARNDTLNDDDQFYALALFEFSFSCGFGHSIVAFLFPFQWAFRTSNFAQKAWHIILHFDSLHSDDSIAAIELKISQLYPVVWTFPSFDHWACWRYWSCLDTSRLGNNDMHAWQSDSVLLVLVIRDLVNTLPHVYPRTLRESIQRFTGYAFK